MLKLSIYTVILNVTSTLFTTLQPVELRTREGAVLEGIREGCRSGTTITSVMSLRIAHRRRDASGRLDTVTKTWTSLRGKNMTASLSFLSKYRKEADIWQIKNDVAIVQESY